MTHSHHPTHPGPAPATPQRPPMPAPARRLRGARHLAALAAAVLTQAAWAQPAPKVLGELLDRGGTPVAAPDVRALIAGATMSGNGVEGRPFDLFMAADGRLTGVVGFARVEAKGTWQVDDQARLCVDLVWGKDQPLKRCFAWFRLGEQYFEAQDGGRGAVLMERRVAR